MQASLGATHCQLLRINTRPPAVASSPPAINMEAFWQTHLRGKLPGCTCDDQHFPHFWNLMQHMLGDV